MQFREQIEINFQAELRKAELLEEAAGQLKNAVSIHMEQTLQVLRLSWKGENADLYQANCRNLLTEINDTAADLRKAALGIRTAAYVMYRAEMIALQLAIQ